MYLPLMRFGRTVVAILLVLAPVAAQEVLPRPYSDTEGYAVISALLNQRLDRNYPQQEKRDFPNPIVIDPFAEPGSIQQSDPSRCFPDAHIQQDWKGAFDNFVELNKHSWMLQKLLETKGYELISTRGFFEDNKTDGWKRFTKAYPHSHGFFTFSVVGFNKARDHAVVYLAFHCGWLCADGGFKLLKKQNGKWVEQTPGLGGCFWVS